MSKSYVIGIDYGSDSVRAVLVDASCGAEISSSVFYYPRWKRGEFCDAALSQFRQHPLDYIEGLEATVKDCLQKSGIQNIGELVKAISVDTTGSTPVAVNEAGVPLALLAEFKDNPNAMFILWKDHTAVKEAKEINRYNQRYAVDYLKYVGGVYSSEWFWAKLLHTFRVDPQVRQATFSWVEHCDYIPFLLTGGKQASAIKRSVCAAGHKSLWAAEFGGLPLSGTAFDFTKPRLMGAHIEDENAQLKIGKGYDHNFELDKKAGFQKVATVYASKTGIQMDIFTTEPGLQFYSGNFMTADDPKGKAGKSYPFRSAFCLETQHFPDAPNHPNFASTVLKPGEKYSSKTAYRFTVK